MIRSLAAPPSAPPMTAGGRFLVVAFHGLAPHTQQPCQELLLQLTALGVTRASLLVVSCRQGIGSIEECPSFLRWLASLAEEGHEVCFQGNPRMTAPIVSFSVGSTWRRITSPLMGRLRFKAARRAPVLQIVVHPDDVYERGVRRTLVALLREALRDRTPITYGELAALASQP